jgi:hypothetical protein
MQTVYAYSLSDTGRVGFAAVSRANGLLQPYVWEKGTLTRIGSGAGFPVWVNNHDSTVLVPGNLSALDRWVAGQAFSVAAPGDQMPGGGRFKDFGVDLYYTNAANDAGQHVFLARITEAGKTLTAAYLLEPGTRETGGGALSLVVKEGMTTELGTITRLGEFYGIGLNSQGQVALPVRIDNGPPTIVLLTPGTVAPGE